MNKLIIIMMEEDQLRFLVSLLNVSELSETFSDASRRFEIMTDNQTSSYLQKSGFVAFYFIIFLNLDGSFSDDGCLLFPTLR